MTRRLRVEPEAQAEAAEAAVWYETKRAGLGADFIAAVDAALERILDAPHAHAVWKPGRPFRRCLVARFPFVVFYTATDESISVLAVAHSARRPGYWLDR